MIDSFKGEYGFLSNFYASPIVMLGFQFPTVEHAFQAMKMTTFEHFEWVRTCNGPGSAKKLAHRLKIRDDWESVKIQVMRECLLQKFAIRELREKLERTRPHDLVEGNTWNDCFWGVCRGVGHNHLGKLLMEIRDQYEQTA